MHVWKTGSNGNICRCTDDKFVLKYGQSNAQEGFLRISHICPSGHIQKSWVRFPGLADFLRISGSGTGSTNLHEES
jgi:hypothetical protein